MDQIDGAVVLRACVKISSVSSVGIATASRHAAAAAAAAGGESGFLKINSSSSSSPALTCTPTPILRRHCLAQPICHTQPVLIRRAITWRLISVLQCSLIGAYIVRVKYVIHSIAGELHQLPIVASAHIRSSKFEFIYAHNFCQLISLSFFYFFFAIKRRK